MLRPIGLRSLTAPTLMLRPMTRLRPLVAPSHRRIHVHSSSSRPCTRPSTHRTLSPHRNPHLSGLQSRRLRPQQAYQLSRTVASSPFDTTASASSSSTPSTSTSTSVARQRLKQFIPRKAAVELTEQARTFFKRLLENPPRPEICGVMLHYSQSKTGEPRMVFSFEFVTYNNLEQAEGVTLEVHRDETTGMITPKTPRETHDDGLRKLYIHQNAFLKVLGATLDVDPETVSPILYDREGNLMDPNA